MQATGISTPGEPIESLIGFALPQTRSDGAYVYSFDHEKSKAVLTAYLGPAPERAEGDEAPQMNRQNAALHLTRDTPIVLHDDAWSDLRFGDLPEFRETRFEGVVSVPLVEASAVVGMVNFCRMHAAPVRPGDLAFLIDLARPMAALVSASTLKLQLQKTMQLLADRKVLDRAKGLIQEELGWSEEQAYMHIRRISRQQRRPMREIAQGLIQTAKQRPEALA